jgi:hypothetical protein
MHADRGHIPPQTGAEAAGIAEIKMRAVRLVNDYIMLCRWPLNDTF